MTGKHYRLRIEDYKTISSLTLDLDPGLQGFVGKNAQGKTNILGAVQALVNSKGDPEAIRDGAEKSVLRLEVLDETGKLVAVVKRTHTRTGSKLEAQGLPMGMTPSVYLASLLDERMLNPIRLISEDPVAYLKKHLDVKFQDGDLPEAFTRLNYAPQVESPFSYTELAADYVGKIRLEKGREVKEKEGAYADMNRLVPALPKEAPGDRATTEDEIRRLTESRGAAEKEMLDRQNREISLRALGSSIENADDKIKAIDNEMQALEVRVSQMRTKKGELRGYIDSARKQQKDIQAQLDAPAPSTEKVDAEIVARQGILLKIREHEELQKRHEHLGVRAKELADMREEHKGLDDLFKYLAYELPRVLISRCDLQVKGLEFRGTDLYVDGRRADLLSETERAILATRVAVALAKKKGHLCISLDGVEIMDEAHRKAWLDLVKDAGLRVFYTRQGEKEGEHEVEVVGGEVRNGN